MHSRHALPIIISNISVPILADSFLRQSDAYLYDSIVSIPKWMMILFLHSCKILFNQKMEIGVPP